jgi:hypothetical protein
VVGLSLVAVAVMKSFAERRSQFARVGAHDAGVPRHVVRVDARPAEKLVRRVRTGNPVGLRKHAFGQEMERIQSSAGQPREQEMTTVQAVRPSSIPHAGWHHVQIDLRVISVEVIHHSGCNTHSAVQARVLQCGTDDAHHLHKPDATPGADKVSSEFGAMLASVTALHEADTRPVKPHLTHHQRVSTGRAQATTSLYPVQLVADG